MVMSLTCVFAEGQEEVTLTVGSIWSAESESNREPVLKTLAEFEEAYPWIHLEVANAWRDKGETLALSDSLPDVFCWNAGGILQTLVDSGDVMALNDFIDEETMARIEGGTLTDMTFDSKIFQLPYTKACSLLYCNTELFDQYNVKIPETWDELLTAVEAFRAAGVTPMAVGSKDQWPPNMYVDIITLRYVGDAACRAAYCKTEGGTFMTDAWVPMHAALLPLLNIMQATGLLKTHWGLIIPYTAFNIPMTILILSGFITGIPYEMEEAACIDGSGIYRTAFTIILPMMLPAIVTAAIFVFLQVWNELLMASVFVSSDEVRTLTVGVQQMYGQYQTDWGPIGAALFIATLPTLILYLCMSGQVQKSLIAGAVKG